MRSSSSDRPQIKWEEKSIKDFTVDQRIGKLEDDVQSVAAIARMLSRHLEKLGVRFRVTRRTLRDPIQEVMLYLTTVCYLSKISKKRTQMYSFIASGIGGDVRPQVSVFGVKLLKIFCFPWRQTAMLALKTSEVVSALASREDMLEAELRETRKELRETQEILVSMQVRFRVTLTSGPFFL